MTDLIDMNAADLRSEYEQAVLLALEHANEIVQAFEAGDMVWMAGMAVALKPTLQRVRRLKRAMTLGSVA